MNGRSATIIAVIVLAVLVGGMVLTSGQSKAPAAVPSPSAMATATAASPTLTPPPSATATALPSPMPTPASTPAPQATFAKGGRATLNGVLVREVISPTQIKASYRNEEILFRSDTRTGFGTRDSAGVVLLKENSNFNEAGFKAGDTLQIQVNWDDRSVAGAFLAITVIKR